MTTTEKPRATRLDTFLRAQRVAHDDWDLILCGDGSGGGWGIGGAYATFLVDKRTLAREVITGGCSRTTVNRMELSAYTEALGFHYHGLLGGTITHPPYNVWIFTDSEITARVGSKIYARKANADLWHTIDWYESRGYRLNWRCIKRNTTDFHVAADGVAGKVRKAILEHVPDEAAVKLMPYVEGDEYELPICELCKTPMQKELTQCPICGQERTANG